MTCLNSLSMAECNEDIEASPVPAPPAVHFSANTCNGSAETVREESKRILEKFLEQQLHTRLVAPSNEEKEVKKDPQTTLQTVLDASTSTSVVTKAELDTAQYCRADCEGQFTRIKLEDPPDETRNGCDPLKQHLRLAAPERQISMDLKSSQSTTCSSFDGTRRRDATGGQQSTCTSAAAAGSFSSSPDAEETDFRQGTLQNRKRKKSLFRRARERLERTLSLGRRRAEEKSERNKKIKSSLFRRVSAAKSNRQGSPPVQRSNSEESEFVKERHVRLKLGRMNVSSDPVLKSNRKRTKLRIVTDESTTSGTKGSVVGIRRFLMPPETAFSAKVKKRRKRDGVGQNDSQNAAPSRIGVSANRGSNSGCSPKRLLKCWALDGRKAGNTPGTTGNGLELLTSLHPGSTSFPDSSGIVHRISGEYHDRSGKAAESSTAVDVQIKLQPPTSGSSDSRSPSFSPKWSGGGESQRGSGHAGEGLWSTESSQERRSSADSMEAKYSLIAQRLADLGDAFLSNQWSQLRRQSSNEDEHNQATGLNPPRIHRLSSVERDVVEFINTCDRDLQSSVGSFGQDIVSQLASSDDAREFGRILNAVAALPTSPIATGWTRLAIIFHLTSAAVGMVGASTDAARRLVNFCCDYVSLTFSGWIVGQGGWSSVVEDQSSDDGERSTNRDF